MMMRIDECETDLFVAEAEVFIPSRVKHSVSDAADWDLSDFDAIDENEIFTPRRVMCLN